MLNAMEKTDSAPFSSQTGNNIDQSSPSHAPPLGDVISSGDFDNDDEGAGPCPVTGTLTQKTIVRSCGTTSAGSHSTLSPIKWSQVKESLRPSDSDCCGGGASGSHPDDRTYSLPIATPYSPARASDPVDFSSDDETFITLQETVVSAASPKNTFECSRRLSAPGQLVQDAGSEAELQSRRPGIAEFFSSKKQRSVSQSVPGWKLFGKIPPKQSPSKQAQIIQQQKTAVILSSLDPQDSTEYEARQAAALYSPTHHVAGQQTRRNKEFEPLSTTALILEQRPLNLPSKSAEETQRHKQQYEQMVAGAKKSELKDAQRKQQQMRERFKQEDVIANATMVWNTQILPHWDSMRSSRRTRDLWWVGLPPSVRGQVWRLSIGNELNITAELYDIFLSRAKKKWRNLGEQDDGIPPAATESSLELIKQDVSRAFPTLGVFQEGGPYHDMLQSILGAYICYRPDVGYVLGMSSVAALLILNMDEVDTFISFSNLVNKPCLLTFYRVDHQLMLKYFRAFDVFFEENLPCLFLHFQTSGVTPDLYLMDWILSLYTKSLPLEVVCRVWDIFFRDGEEFLFRAALGILQLYQDVLLSMDLVSIAQFLSHLPNEELLSDRLFSCIGTIPMLTANRKWTQVLSSMNSS